MPGETPQLNALQARKQLLIVECEVHREMLRQDGVALAGNLRELNAKAKSLIHLATSAAGAVSAISSILPEKDPAANGGGSFFKTMLKGLRLGTSLWLAFKKGRE